MSDVRRDPMITVKHSKTHGEGKVPLSAVPYYESRGWTADSGEVREAAKLAKAGETGGANSKKTSD